MSSLSRLRRWVSLGLVLVSLTGCLVDTTEPKAPEERWEEAPAGWSAPEPWKGPPATWSASVPGDANTAVMIGRVLVVHTGRTVLGIDAGTGERLWRLPAYHLGFSGGLVVAYEEAGWLSDEVPTDGRVRVVDPATGRILWSRDPLERIVVAEDGIFTLACSMRGCFATRYEPRSGEALWHVRVKGRQLASSGLEERRSLMPPAQPYLLTDSAEDVPDSSWALLDTESGRISDTRVRPPGDDGYLVVAGRTVVAVDDPSESEERDRCPVGLTGFDAASGREKWKAEVFHGSPSEGECGGDTYGFGVDSRIAAYTEDGRPQVFDLTTGRTVWRGKAGSELIHGNDRVLLVRESTGKGGLALLDSATGRVLWRVPDSGSNGWVEKPGRVAVSDRFVAVSGDEEDPSRVLVHRIDDGRLVGDFPGRLEGLGEDWVALTHDFGRPDSWKFQLEFIRL